MMVPAINIINTSSQRSGDTSILHSSTGGAAAQHNRQPNGGSYMGQSQRSIVFEVLGQATVKGKVRYIKNEDDSEKANGVNEDGFEQYYMMNDTLGENKGDFQQSPERSFNQDCTAKFQLQDSTKRVIMPSPGSQNLDSGRLSQRDPQQTLAQSKSVDKFDTTNQGQFFSSNGYDMVKCNHCGRGFFSGKFHIHLKVCGKIKPSPINGSSEDQSSRQSQYLTTQRTENQPVRKMASNYLQKMAANQIAANKKDKNMVYENLAQQVIPTKRQLVPAALQKKNYNNYANFYSNLSTLQANNSSESLTPGHSQLRMGAISSMSVDKSNPQQSVMPKWKREHLSFIKNIRQINQLSPFKTSQNRSESLGQGSSSKRSIYYDQRDLQSIEIPDDLVQCPHCQRKFSNKASDRHIAVCSTIKNRPRPPPNLASILNLNQNSKDSKRTISEYKYDQQSWSRSGVTKNVSTSQNFRRNNVLDNKLSYKPMKVQQKIQLSLDRSPASSHLYSNNSSLSNNVRGSLQLQKSRVSFIPSNQVHKKSLEVQKKREETPDRGGTFFLSAVDQSFQSQSKSVLQRHSQEYSQQVHCPLCKKYFSRKAGERHIPVCAQIMNKPSRLVRDRSRQSVGIRIDTNRDNISVNYRSNNVSILSSQKREKQAKNQFSPESNSQSLSGVRKPSVPINRSALFKAQIQSLRLQPSSTSNTKTKISTLNNSYSQSNNTQQGRNYQTIVNQINRHKIQTETSATSPYNYNVNRIRFGVGIATDQSVINSRNNMQKDSIINEQQSRYSTARNKSFQPPVGRLKTIQQQTISEDTEETQRQARKIAQGMVYKSIQQQIRQMCNSCRKVMRPCDVFCSQCGVKRTFKMQASNKINIDKGAGNLLKRTSVNQSAIFIQENTGGQTTVAASSNQQSQSVLSSNVINKQNTPIK